MTSAQAAEMLVHLARLEWLMAAVGCAVSVRLGLALWSIVIEARKRKWF